MTTRVSYKYPSDSTHKVINMKWFFIFCMLFLQACSNLPANIQNPPTVDIQLHQVLKSSNQYQNQPVRWGGTVIDVENETDKTTLQILFYPLDYYGRPRINQKASGRFISISPHFLDPAIYSTGTQITIAGTIQNTVIKQIGKKPVSIPVIAINTAHIWPNYRQTDYWDYDYGYRYPYYGYRRSYYPYNYYRSRYRYYNYCD